MGVGNTVDSLVKAYVDNTVCIGKYKNVVNGIDNYNNKIKKLKEQEGDDNARMQ